MTDKLTNVESRVMFALRNHVGSAALTIDEIAGHLASHGGDVINVQELREACSALQNVGLIEASINDACVVRYWAL